MSTQPLSMTPEQVNAAFTAQWKKYLRQKLADTRVSIPARVLAFDATTQTVTAEIVIRERVRTPQGAQNVVIQPIGNVPIVVPRGGGLSLTLPLQPNDEGMLVFCDMCIDSWWQSGGVQNQFAVRRHHLSDCGFIPGFWSQPNVLANYSATSAQLRTDDGETVIDVSPSGITITSNQPVTVNASQVTLKAPAISAANGGATQPLMTDAFYQYWVSAVYPFLTSLGFTGGPPPNNSETAIFKAQ